MKNKLLIIGASGHGKVVADVAIKMNKWHTIEFLDDDLSIKNPLGLEIIDISKHVEAYITEYDFFVGIGNNEVRRKVTERLKKSKAKIATLIHPSAIIAEEVVIGRGTVVTAGVIINSSTNIGEGCIINTGSTVDHDNTFGDYVHISPGANIAGTVKIGDNTWIGTGGIVSNNIYITNNCIVGAGGVVVRDINESGTYIGVPVHKKNTTL